MKLTIPPCPECQTQLVEAPSAESGDRRISLRCPSCSKTYYPRLEDASAPPADTDWKTARQLEASDHVKLIQLESRAKLEQARIARHTAELKATQLELEKLGSHFQAKYAATPAMIKPETGRISRNVVELPPGMSREQLVEMAKAATRKVMERAEQPIPSDPGLAERVAAARQDIASRLEEHRKEAQGMNGLATGAEEIDSSAKKDVDAPEPAQ